MENEVKGLTRFGLMARDHWAEFRPRMVAHLKKEGVYLAALLNAQEQASAMIAEQVSRLGNDLESAREMALAQFVLLRSEKEQPVLDADSMPYSQPEPPSAPTMWVPDLRLSRAAALAVPLDQDYHEAIRDKLVGLLERAGKRQARAAMSLPTPFMLAKMHSSQVEGPNSPALAVAETAAQHIASASLFIALSTVTAQ